MPVELRDVTPSDDDAILDLWVAAWSSAMPGIDFAARRQWFRSRLVLLRDEHFVLRCASEDTSGTLVGFIAISPKLRYLDHIAARPDHWGGDLGKALIEEAMRLSPQGIVLDVNQANSRAIAFYEKHGFQRLQPDRNPISGLPTWWYVWGEAEPPARL